jgi:hypothetical protein
MLKHERLGEQLRKEMPHLEAKINACSLPLSHGYCLEDTNLLARHHLFRIPRLQMGSEGFLGATLPCS